MIQDVFYPFFLALYSEGGMPIVLVNNREK